MAKGGSLIDTRGMLQVDCAECERGGNGSDSDKCAGGWQYKTRGRGACFCGVLIPGTKVRDLRKEANDGR